MLNYSSFQIRTRLIWTLISLATRFNIIIKYTYACLHHRSCPPASYWGSRVYSLVFSLLWRFPHFMERYLNDRTLAYPNPNPTSGGQSDRMTDKPTNRPRWCDQNSTNEISLSLNKSRCDVVSNQELSLRSFFIHFLVAYTRLYNPLCPSVCLSVHLSVCLSRLAYYCRFTSF